MEELIKVINYKKDTDISQIFNCTDSTPGYGKKLWLRITSLEDKTFLMDIAERFGVHSLLIDDAINQRHQAKFEQYDNYSMVILKCIHETDGELDTSQFSMIFGKDFLITFEHEENSDISSYTKNPSKLKNSIERVIYDLIDRIFDSYLAYASKYQDKTDEMEDFILEHAETYKLSELFDFKQEMHFFRRIVRPARELTDMLLRPKANIFNDGMYPYLKDLSDHASRVVNMADNIEETLISLHSIVLTQLQYKLAKTMNLMTAVSVIFLPLMVITGIYGMNFEHMPELPLKYAYPVVLGFMALLGVGMFTFFIKRKLI